MIHVLSNGRYFDDMALLSDAERQDLELSNEQHNLYNSRNEILRSLVNMAESLGYDSPRDSSWITERFEIVTNRYNEKIKAIDKQLSNSNEKLMALIENGC